MKIFYLITKSEIGGAQTHVLQLAKFFSSQGNSVSVMASPGGWLESELKKNNIIFFPNEHFGNYINPFKVWKMASRLREVVKNFDPDLVHCHSSAAGIIGRLVIRNRVKTVFTAHGWSFNKGVPAWWKVFGLISEWVASFYCKKIICVSNYVKNLALKYHVANSDKLVVVYNGVNYNQSILESKKYCVGESLKIVFVGRISKPKRPDLAIEAVSLLNEKDRQRISLDIIGAGNGLEKLKTFKNNILPTGSVNFLGSCAREKTLEVLKAADLLLLISDWEGFPYSILEAMSLGVPVLASRVGGISEVIDSKNGWLVGNSAFEIKEVLLEILNNTNLVKEKGGNALDKIKNNFSEEKMFLEIEKVYKSL